MHNFEKCTKWKWFSFTISCVLFVFSVVMISVSSNYLGNMRDYCEISNDKGQVEAAFCWTPIIFNIFGAFILITIMTGCLGFLWQNHRMVIAYGSMVTFLLMLMIGASIAVFGFKVNIY